MSRRCSPPTPPATGWGTDMSTGFYLIDNPNRAFKQYREVRRHGRAWRGLFVVHTGENNPNFTLSDAAALALARFIASRSTAGSYHVVFDSMRTIPMAPTRYECWHDTSSNPFSVGGSFATQAHRWTTAPPAWRERILARGARWFAARADELFLSTGIDIEAVWLTRAQAMAGRTGFVRHGTMDPGRRSDPWPVGSPSAARLLVLYRQYRVTGRYASNTPPPSPDPSPAPPPPPPKEWYEMPIPQSELDKIADTNTRVLLNRTRPKATRGGIAMPEESLVMRLELAPSRARDAVLNRPLVARNAGTDYSLPAESMIQRLVRTSDVSQRNLVLNRRLRAEVAELRAQQQVLLTAIEALSVSTGADSAAFIAEVKAALQKVKVTFTASVDGIDNPIEPEPEPELEPDTEED